MRQASVVEVHDARVDIRFADNASLAVDSHFIFYVGYPVISPEGHVIGALCGFDTKPRVLDEAQRGAMQDLVGIVQNQFALGVLANRDTLTGLYNRRYFDERLQEEWSRQARVGVPISLLFFDVDHFKHYNDEFGHPQGDRCLQRIADTANNAFGRVGDFVSRYGGEEFVVLLSGTDQEGGQHKAEELRALIEDMGIEHAQSSDTDTVTISVGGATMTPKRNALSNALVERADQALYQAKNGGRNQVWWDESK